MGNVIKTVIDVLVYFPLRTGMTDSFGRISHEILFFFAAPRKLIYSVEKHFPTRKTVNYVVVCMDKHQKIMTLQQSYEWKCEKVLCNNFVWVW